MAASGGAFLAVVEATSQDAPVRASERGVAERVADGVDRTVDVTQPITYNINATIFIFFTPVLFFFENFPLQFGSFQKRDRLTKFDVILGREVVSVWANICCS